MHWALLSVHGTQIKVKFQVNVYILLWVSFWKSSKTESLSQLAFLHRPWSPEDYSLWFCSPDFWAIYLWVRVLSYLWNIQRWPCTPFGTADYCHKNKQKKVHICSPASLGSKVQENLGSFIKLGELVKLRPNMYFKLYTRSLKRVLCRVTLATVNWS